MKGILVLAHGSRAKETEITMETVLAMVKKKMPDIILEHAYMEFSERNIGAAVKKLIDKGVEEIKVVPYFLFAGIHLKEDIPDMVKECIANNPGIKITMGNTLGADERLAEILIDRIKD